MRATHSLQLQLSAIIAEPWCRPTREEEEDAGYEISMQGSLKNKHPPSDTLQHSFCARWMFCLGSVDVVFVKCDGHDRSHDGAAADLKWHARYARPTYRSQGSGPYSLTPKWPPYLPAPTPITTPPITSWSMACQKKPNTVSSCWDK